MNRAALRVVLLLLATAFVVLVPGSARACACGVAYPSAGESLQAGEEVAFLSRTPDGRERMEMSLSLTGEGTEVAVVIPTPAAPEVSQGSSDRLAELAELSEPPPDPEPEQEGDGVGAAPGAGAPDVVSETVLDDVVATVLEGGTPRGVVRWLADNGYEQKPVVMPVLRSYLEQGWLLTAVKLRADVPLSGQLDPIVLTFDSDELVYPMRFSSVADSVSPVTTFVLDESFVSRASVVDGTYAHVLGAVILEPDDVDDDELRDLVASGLDHLTAISNETHAPADVDDFTFSADAAVAPTHTVHEATAAAGGAAADSEDGGLRSVILVGGSALAVLLAVGAVFFATRRS